jgi:hypothetical protein
MTLKEVQVIYMTEDEDKDEEDNRIYMFYAINDGKNLIPNPEIIMDGEQVDNAIQNGVKKFPLYTREMIENQEKIKKDAFKNFGFTLKEDLYKLIESSAEGNMIVFTVEVE